MTHFWVTAPEYITESTIVRYYFDGETEASIEFYPHLACGVGFGDPFAPWGTRWFGKGAADGGWYNNFRFPFQQSVIITLQTRNGTSGAFFFIARGLPNAQINIGGVKIPQTARMRLHKFQQLVSPLEWVPIVDQPDGNGLFWMQTLSVASGSLNFLEGCYHQYTPYDTPFPGVLLSTGTEDYFDSAWYFNAGQFRFENAGYTHYSTPTNISVHWSAYRFHEMDPIVFSDGLLLLWRNGDTVDRAGIKCFTTTAEDGTIVGKAKVTNSYVISYAWVYHW